MKWLWKIWRAKAELTSLITTTKDALEDKKVSAKEARAISMKLIETLERLELIK